MLSISQKVNSLLISLFLHDFPHASICSQISFFFLRNTGVKCAWSKSDASGYVDLFLSRNLLHFFNNVQSLVKCPNLLCRVWDVKRQRAGLVYTKSIIGKQQ
jgi:hypothetical protein